MKRPDLILRNRTNNPMFDPVAREKMRQSQIGKKHSQATRIKMSLSHKKIMSQDPTLKDKMLRGAEEKYLSKIRGTGWGLVRLEALRRDNHTCQTCGEKEKRLIVHHKDWQGKVRGVSMKDWNNNLDNLITLCDKCHNGIHRHKAKDYQERKAQIAL